MRSTLPVDFEPNAVDCDAFLPPEKRPPARAKQKTCLQIQQRSSKVCSPAAFAESSLLAHHPSRPRPRLKTICDDEPAPKFSEMRPGIITATVAEHLPRLQQQGKDSTPAARRNASCMEAGPPVRKPSRNVKCGKLPPAKEHHPLLGMQTPHPVVPPPQTKTSPAEGFRITTVDVVRQEDSPRRDEDLPQDCECCDADDGDNQDQHVDKGESVNLTSVYMELGRGGKHSKWRLANVVQHPAQQRDRCLDDDVSRPHSPATRSMEPERSSSAAAIRGVLRYSRSVPSKAGSLKTRIHWPQPSPNVSANQAAIVALRNLQTALTESLQLMKINQPDFD